MAAFTQGVLRECRDLPNPNFYEADHKLCKIIPMPFVLQKFKPHCLGAFMREPGDARRRDAPFSMLQDTNGDTTGLFLPSTPRISAQ